jgi:hypothetical protein
MAFMRDARAKLQRANWGILAPEARRAVRIFCLRANIT